MIIGYAAFDDWPELLRVLSFIFFIRLFPFLPLLLPADAAFAPDVRVILLPERKDTVFFAAVFLFSFILAFLLAFLPFSVFPKEKDTAARLTSLRIRVCTSRNSPRTVL